MDKKKLLKLIKLKLEAEGTKFSDYYGTPIYNSGPKPSEFFESSNEGNFTIEVLTIPKMFITETINTEKVSSFLKMESIND